MSVDVFIELVEDTHFSDSACALVAESLGVSIVDKFSAERWRGTLIIRRESRSAFVHAFYAVALLRSNVASSSYGKGRV